MRLTPAAIAALDLESLSEAESVAFVREQFGVGMAEALEEVLAEPEPELTETMAAQLATWCLHRRSVYQVLQLCPECVERMVAADRAFMLAQIGQGRRAHAEEDA